MARSNKGGKAIYGRMQFLLEKQKLHRTASRQANAQFNPREILDIYFSRLHYKIAISSGIQLYFSSSRLINKDGVLYSNYRKDVGKRTS